ncbi:sensor domain-containing diguanylate cyclase [Alkalibacillus aidingensis]|uniref:sensor domain-containing diguanylate cyclase n=1 Tax=Alkalibacillus aidingensis TaxID=2747607 RepID=UPI00166116E5|nr:sensor domain-containing diguanylate cyclase [Alkalibacillus aidingensis]
MNKHLSAQDILIEQSKVIELLAMEQIPLWDTLKHLISTLDLSLEGIYSSILLLDKDSNQLGNAIAPNLPSDLVKMFKGIEIGPQSGSCGTAAYLNEPVLVEDIHDSLLWEGLSDKLGSFGIRSSWSKPITSTNGELFGTLAFYSKEKRLPTEKEMQVFDAFANLAAVIIAKKKSEESVRLAETVIESTPAVVLRWKNEPGWPIEYISKNVEQFGYSSCDFLGEKTPFSSIIHEDDLDRITDEVEYYKQNGINEYQQEYRIRTKDGSIKWVDDRTIIIRGYDNQIKYIEGVLIDITDRKRAEKQVQFFANNDPLTELPNRRYFKEKLDQVLKDARHQNRRIALLYLDCDNFKKINDDLGHDAGDEFLTYLARRLKNAVREEDLIARIGGDEFNVLVRNVYSDLDVQRVAERLIETVSKPWEVDGNIYHVTMSVGVAVYPSDGEAGDELIKRADQALYRAKQGGKNQVVWYLNDHPSAK